MQPKPPPGPPNREFKTRLFGGMVETKNSIQRRHDYETFMHGFMLGQDAAISAEREACAGICDRFAVRGMHPAECAGAIRMRSNKEVIGARDDD